MYISTCVYKYLCICTYTANQYRWKHLCISIISICLWPVCIRNCPELSNILDLNIFSALALFLCWDLLCWTTVIPVGTCVTFTIESVVLTCWPPAPEDLHVSIIKSLSSSITSVFSASGNIATVTADVWTLPLDSVMGTLWTLCTPDSNFSEEKTFAP